MLFILTIQLLGDCSHAFLLTLVQLSEEGGVGSQCQAGTVLGHLSKIACHSMHWKSLA